MITKVWLWEDNEVLHEVEVKADTKEKAIFEALVVLSVEKVEFDLDGKFRVDVLEGDETLQMNPLTGEWDKIHISEQRQFFDGRWQ